MCRQHLPDQYRPKQSIYDSVSGQNAVAEFLNEWCLALPKPLVLFIDEIDTLIGDSLLSVLRQLRSGYTNRPEGFPHALALIGIRDIRDYRIYSETQKDFILGGSAFNIKEDSLIVDDFTPTEVKSLYQQHTDETGQVFTSDAIDTIYENTKGQPWLVNALGRELCFGKGNQPS